MLSVCFISVYVRTRFQIRCSRGQAIISMEGLVSRLNSRSCEKISYFNRKCAVDALTGLTLLSESMPDPSPPQNATLSGSLSYSTSMESFICLQCKMQFNDFAEMVMCSFNFLIHFSESSL